MSNKYLGEVDGVMNFYCVRPDHSETVRDEHVLRRDYDTLAAELAAVKARLAECRSALRAAMDDVPGWYDLARAARAADSAGEKP